MHLLDNPIWNALNTSQAHLGRGDGVARKFLPDVSLLGGFSEPSNQSYASLSALVDRGERVGLFLHEEPKPPSDWKIVASIPLLQMIHEGEKVNPGENRIAIVPLGEDDVAEMLRLTKLTKPGPFGTRTREMGDYFGVRQNGALVAMTGERLKMPGFTEISAVCTHPEHLGRGYAAALMTLVLRRIQARGEQAFLHVREDNARAIALYERLGFRRRLLSTYALLARES